MSDPWTPGLTICNSAKSEIVDKDFIKYRIHHTGVITTSLHLQSTSYCQLDFRRLPWDRHHCGVCLRVVSIVEYSTDLDVNFAAGFSAIFDSQWDPSRQILIGYTKEELGVIKLSMATFSFWLDRSSSTLILLIVLPMNAGAVGYMVIAYFAEGIKVLAEWFVSGTLFGAAIFFFASYQLPQQRVTPALGWTIGVHWLLSFTVSVAYVILGYVLKDDDPNKKKKKKEKADEDLEAVLFTFSFYVMRGAMRAKTM
ncbi:hypothetical protein PRIPAC_95003 [Pristionchus pacificus]|uniref:Transmembrane ion channel n=1 Tax=Pristionchus pacificus TaxID=54126 RepID=A0A2A6BA10_PRIPA|nr:hypothetical protein PRIPAC_93865 [Pristionchus pacificus]KAF8360008.1 hypothetical protein PRIPAC_95003 [Pristionchus pacificus]|eukprot:PDM62716.1 transmembrane ion channel [Pristionchus pacificus]